MENEKWTSEIINSVRGMSRAEPSPYLYSKILTRLNSKNIEKIPVKWAFLSFASLSLLFIINITFTLHPKTKETQEIIIEQQMMNSDQLY